MKRKSYYMILGVPRTESPKGIRAAYRDRAKKLHPDVAGQQATSAFQELTEAYEVLSNPQRRRDYNTKLGRAEPRKSAAPDAGRREPSVPEPSVESSYNSFLGNDSPFGVPRDEPPERMEFDVLLTHEEASHGCVVPLTVPTFVRCPACGGSGRGWNLPCVYCRQKGIIRSEVTVRVRIPSGSRSGTKLELPLHAFGIDDVCLTLRLVVGAQLL